MKKNLLTLMALLAVGASVKSFAQWNLTGNSNATSSSVLGTTNAAPLNLVTKNIKRLVIDTTGRVGIGIASPTQLLTVQSSGAAPATSWISSGKPVFAGYGEGIPGNSDFNLLMASSTAANARGVFGLKRSRGTLAIPTAVATNDQLGSLLVSGFDGTFFQGSAAVDFFADGAPSTGNVPARISFVTGTNSGNRTERMRIGNTGDISINNTEFNLKSSTGNIGIGTTSPAARLDIRGATPDSGVVFSLGDSANRHFVRLFGGRLNDPNPFIQWHSGDPLRFATDTPFVERLRIDANGNVGIGTPSPTARLSVNGAADKPGGGSWATFSDARLKQNIQDYTDGLTEVKKIKPVTYHYNTTSGFDTKPAYVGVIAQDLKVIAPYMVTNNKAGINKSEYLQVDNSAMTYMLVNAVKELAKQNDEATKKNDELAKEMAELKALVLKIMSDKSSAPCPPLAGK